MADNHGYDSYDVLSRIIHQNEYIDLSYYVLDRYYSNIPESQEFPLSHQELLKKIKRPVLLPEFNYQESQRQTWPFTSNTASQLFFFIFTGEGKINFDHFNPLQASHFIDIPGINFNFTYSH